jgi:predicted lipoprotein with Yx(FWY)xxD motif
MATFTTTAKIRSGGAAALVGVALIVAGCGSSSSTSTAAPATSSAAAAPATSSSASATAAPVSAKGVSIGTAKNSSGTYLTGASGRALYLWEADSPGMSSCSGACAKAWPPLTTTGTPSAGHGVTAGDLGTISRSDGTKQVTYKGHPLYYFVADTTAGSTKGQGSDSFGAKWWLVAPSGTAITAGAPKSAGGGSSSGAASSSSSSSAGGGWS